MAANAKKVLINTERHDVFVIHHQRPAAIVRFCPSCKEDVEMMSFDRAISYSRIPARRLISAADHGAIHSVETIDGHLLICKISLTKGEIG